MIRRQKFLKCEGNQQLKRSGAIGFHTKKEMSSYLLDKPFAGTIGSSVQVYSKHCLQTQLFYLRITREMTSIRTIVGTLNNENN